MGGNTSTVSRGMQGVAMGSSGAAPRLPLKLEMSTPGWQFFWKTIIFLSMILIFGAIYQGHMSGNKDSWSQPSDENDKTISNGFYAASVITSTVGYGDYYPYSSGAIAIVIINVLMSWVLFSSYLG